MKIVTDSRVIQNFLKSRGARVTGPTRAVIQEGGRYKITTAVVRFSQDGTVTATPGYDLEPTASEEKAMKEAVADLPDIKEETILRRPTEKLCGLVGSNSRLFWFRDRMGAPLFAVERFDTGDGGKAYIPWTYWSDKEWRKLEPEGDLLPLYGLEHLEKNGVVFIHEGPKTVADLLAKLAKGDHPWQAELEDAVHIGWHGGARNSHRTNWAPLRNVDHAYIVPDNDDDGREAIRPISRNLRCPTRLIQFDDKFPIGFDLGDDFPDFDTSPSFGSYIQPATFMTEEIPKAEGDKSRKPHYRLRKHAAKEWLYCEKANVFLSRLDTLTLLSPEQLNNTLAPFSDVNNVVPLINKARTIRSVNLAYRPDLKDIFITEDRSAINTYRGPNIKPADGDPKPFVDFMKHLVPNKLERENVMCWIATLIARPEVRMRWALLMISVTEGVGKTTLGEKILTPLLGRHNVSVPSQKSILGEFNEWVAHKRLAIVSEIHENHNWKLPLILKDKITDERMTVNRKNIREYEIENWCHIYACSNFPSAIKIMNEDRRWYIPTITEKLKPATYWVGFNEWLKGDGLAIILHWAQSRRDYVRTGSHAPQSEAKDQMIEDSESEAIRSARELAAAFERHAEPASLFMRDIETWLKTKHGPYFDAAVHMRRAMTETGGVLDMGKQSRIGKSYVLINPALARKLGIETAPETRGEAIIEALKSSKSLPDQINPEPM